MKQLSATCLTTGHRERIGSALRTRFPRESWIASLVALVLVLTQGAGQAADVTVVNTNNSGAGSLRQAIVDVPVAGTINFNSGLGGQTITLATELILDKAITIDASGLTGGLTVSGGGLVRLIRVNASGNLTLRNLTLTGGKGIGAADNGFGGALYNAGTTAVERCTFSGNSAATYGGGIHNAPNATLAVNYCMFTVDAGLIGNSAGLYGGAIFTSSLLTVNGSTFDRNKSDFEGGGVYSDFSSTLTITNSTFTGNSAAFFGGAVFNGSPRMNLGSSTLVGNHADRIGGAIYNDFFGTPSANIQNSIITENTAPEAGNIYGPWTGANNITSGDPKLSPLGNFGGPTKTMPPLPDSPAIDAGGSTALLTDQRVQPRILGAALDVGAYECAFSDYNPAGVTIYGRVTSGDTTGVFEISTDPDFLPDVTTLAGTGTDGFADGARLSSKLGFPSGVTRDSLGNIFFADTGNNRIRMIGPDGVVTTIAGIGTYGLANGPGPTAEFAFPAALAVGPDDNVYVADTYNHRICKVTRPAVPGGEWTVTNLAGTGFAGFVEGSGSVARFNYPYGLVLDAGGNVFVADSGNHRIRKVTPVGAVSTYAGSGAADFLDSSTASAAKFNTPRGVVIARGNLYVADTGNHRIRQITAVGAAAGVVSTFAGSTAGFADANGTVAKFDTPSGIATDVDGVLYIADKQNNRIRKIDSSGTVTTVAGTGDSGLINGKSDIARFKAPTGVVVSLDKKTLMVADAENHVLRRVAMKPVTVQSTSFTDAYGVQVKTVLDVEALGLDPGVTYYFRWVTTGGIEQPLGQSFFLYDFPTVVTHAASSVSPSSAVLNAIVDPKAGPTVVTFEYSTDPGLLKPYEVRTFAGAAAQFSNPSGVVTNAAGDAFVADRLNHRIRRITPAGVVTTFAGSGVAGFANASDTTAQFEKPTGLAIDGSGNLYVADESNHRIRKITPAGVVTTFAGSGVAGFAEGDAASAKFLYPSGVAVDVDGNVYVADSGNQRIRKITAATGMVSTLAGSGVAGFTDGTVESAQFSSPQALAVDASGRVLVADTGNHGIRAIEAGSVTTLAGTGVEGFLDGPGGSAMLASPRGVALDAAGAVYVTDSGNHRIRQIFPSGQVSTFAGSGNPGHVDSPAVGLFPITVCQFDLPLGITVDGSGTLFVTQEGMLRKIARSATLPTVTVTPDATGTGERALMAAVDQPLLYGTTYYFQARGTSYRDSVTGGILSFVTPQANILVFAGNNTSAPALAHLQADIVDFGITPTGQAVTREFTIFNPGSWPLTVSTVNFPSGFQLTGGIGVVNPLGSATFQVTLPATSAGNFSGNVVITNDAPEKTVFSFPIAGVVLDPPALTTLAASAAGTGTATLNATVNPKASSTTVWFEWSQDPEFDGVMVSTLAGATSGFAEGVGTAAKFNQPSGIATDAAGNIYVADKQNHRIRKVAADGTASTFAGTGEAGLADGPGDIAQFDQPVGLAMSASGTLFVADSNNHCIRAIDSTGEVVTYSGLGAMGFTDGIATAARFNSPAGLAIDSQGVLYVADSNNHRIRKVATDGSVSTLAGTGVAGTANGAVAQFNSPVGIARDSSGFLYVTETNSQAIRKIAPDGFTSVFASGFSSPTGLAVGVGGLLYVADKGNHRIRSVSPGGVVTTVAGTGISGTANGFGEIAQFASPLALATTASGAVIVGESGGSTSVLRKITSLQVLLQAAAGLVGTANIPVEFPVTGLPANGTYYFRSIATNGGGTTIGATLGNSTFAAWKIAKFGANAANPLIAGPSASPTGDGMSNLLKYAFGLDPLIASAGSAPVMGLSSGSLTLTYTKFLSASDLLYTVEWSPDLVNWSSAGVTEQTVVGGASGTQRILATAPGAPAEAKFLRVHITLQ
ncbi:MAG: choice-of-anchor Q domain-containing protein [Verrucomicrobiota bacterium]